MPSPSSEMALRATRLLMRLAPIPCDCPSTSTNDKPPCGRSTISKVSPLSCTDHLLTLATPTCTSIDMSVISFLIQRIRQKLHSAGYRVYPAGDLGFDELHECLPDRRPAQAELLGYLCAIEQRTRRNHAVIRIEVIVEQ